jgi:hypothetical protein
VVNFCSNPVLIYFGGVSIYGYMAKIAQELNGKVPRS